MLRRWWGCGWGRGGGWGVGLGWEGGLGAEMGGMRRGGFMGHGV